MARTSLQDVHNLPDALMTYNFDLLISGLEKYGAANSGTISVRCMTASLPGMQIDQVTVPLKGYELNYAGRPVYTKQMPVTLHETKDVLSRQIMFRWMRDCRNALRNTGLAKAQYAKQATIIIYDDLPVAVQTTKVMNLWPLNLDDLNLDGSSSTAAQYSLSFSYDYTVEQGESE